MKKLIRLSCLSLLILYLQGCGFHLRGLVDKPRWLDKLAIIIQSDETNLEGLLRSELQAYHIAVCPNHMDAAYWLLIERSSFRQEIGSISSTTTPRQYELIYTVWFQLKNKQGEEITPLMPVKATRLITINNERILGSEAEAATTKNEMKREAVRQILNQINRLGAPKILPEKKGKLGIKREYY